MGGWSVSPTPARWRGLVNPAVYIAIRAPAHRMVRLAECHSVEKEVAPGSRRRISMRKKGRISADKAALDNVVYAPTGSS